MVRDDTWKIQKEGDTFRLWHNNYAIVGDYTRCFTGGFHLQKEGVGGSSLGHFVNIVVDYSWGAHVEWLKEQKVESECQRLREFMARVLNFVQASRFSLWYDYYIVLDCDDRLSRFLCDSGVSAKWLGYEASDDRYMLWGYRVPKIHRQKFMKVLDDLKDYCLECG